MQAIVCTQLGDLRISRAAGCGVRPRLGRARRSWCRAIWQLLMTVTLPWSGLVFVNNDCADDDDSAEYVVVVSVEAAIDKAVRQTRRPSWRIRRGELPCRRSHLVAMRRSTRLLFSVWPAKRWQHFAFECMVSTSL